MGILMIDDIYLMTASKLPGLREPVIEYFSDPKNCDLWMQDPEICKEDPKIKGPRKQAKPACLGFNYGMGPRRFVTQCYDAGISVSYRDAKAMYKAYWELFKGIQSLVKKLELHTKKNHFIENPFGYRLTTEPHKAYNAFIQSSASGVVDLFCLKFFEECPDIKFIALIHDEVVYAVPEHRLEEVKEIQKQCVTWLNQELKFTIPMRLGFVPAKTFADIK